ncbi:MAG: hypothetical protein IT579_08995 [Verrucomicrobia subdivision 3 bacterium]|nr:hypothetical protein [Verrucomicrobiota bacterium]MCC6820851.1 hypothetical protein [Limisphaerales bacterium]
MKQLRHERQILGFFPDELLRLLNLASAIWRQWNKRRKRRGSKTFRDFDMQLRQRDTRSGFTLVDFLVIVAVLTVIIAFLLSALSGPKRHQPGLRCSNNLKQVSLAFRQWSLDNNDKLPMEVSVTNGGAMEAVLAGNVAAVYRVMSNELSTPKILVCPEDKRRIQTTTFSESAAAGGNFPGVYFSNNSNASYFIHLAPSSSTSQMLWVGDDNLLVGGKATGAGVAIKGLPVPSGILSLWTNLPVAWSAERHEKMGNIGLADGSVQGFSSSKLAEALRNTGAVTNRLAFP